MNPPNKIGKADKGSDKKLKEQFGKEMPFKEPNGYFEELPDQILDACKENDLTSKRSFLRITTLTRIAAAAAILIFATLILTLVFNKYQTNDDLYTDYDAEEVYLYNINSLSDLEESYLLSLIEDTEGSLYFYEDEMDFVSSDIIVEYLLAENHIEYLALSDY
jgi:hypothetical protein